jgi:hypothetical protein
VDGSTGRIERRGVKIVSGCTGCLEAEIAGVDFRVGEHVMPPAVDERHGVAGASAGLALEVRDGDGHPELPCKMAKAREEGVVPGDRL